MLVSLWDTSDLHGSKWGYVGWALASPLGTEFQWLPWWRPWLNQLYRMAGDWHTNWFEQLGCLKGKYICNAWHGKPISFRFVCHDVAPMHFIVVWKKKGRKNILWKSELATKHKEPFHINQLYHDFFLNYFSFCFKVCCSLDEKFTFSTPYFWYG